MVWHHMPFYYFYTFVFAECSYDFLQVLSVLIVYYFSSLFWYDYYVCRFVNDVLHNREREKDLIRRFPVKRAHREIVVSALMNG